MQIQQPVRLPHQPSNLAIRLRADEFLDRRLFSGCSLLVQHRAISCPKSPMLQPNSRKTTQAKRGQPFNRRDQRVFSSTPRAARRPRLPLDHTPFRSRNRALVTSDIRSNGRMSDCFRLWLGGGRCAPAPFRYALPCTLRSTFPARRPQTEACQFNSEHRRGLPTALIENTIRN